jgi:hypothetical protein
VLVLAVLDHRQTGGFKFLTSEEFKSPFLGELNLVLAMLEHRQFFRVFVLSIGEAGHETTTAPASGGTGWRSPASGPGQRRDSTPAADRACRGLVVVSGA